MKETSSPRQGKSMLYAAETSIFHTQQGRGFQKDLSGPELSLAEADFTINLRRGFFHV